MICLDTWSELLTKNIVCCLLLSIVLIGFYFGRRSASQSLCDKQFGFPVFSSSGAV